MESRSFDLKMVLFGLLARESQSRGQYAAANRLLVAAGNAACCAGWLEVAKRCRQLIVQNNPRHWLSRYASIPDALRDTAETASLFRQAEAICSFETAEHYIIEQLGQQAKVDRLLADPGPGMQELLRGSIWPDTHRPPK